MHVGAPSMVVISRLRSLKFVYVSRGSRDLAGQAFLLLSRILFFSLLLLVFFLFTWATKNRKGRPAKEVRIDQQFKLLCFFEKVLKTVYLKKDHPELSTLSMQLLLHVHIIILKKMEQHCDHLCKLCRVCSANIG